MQIRKQKRWLWILILGWVIASFSATVFAADKKILPLPSEEAFGFSIAIQNPQEVQVNWHISPGNYLYRDRFHFSFEPKTQADIHFPTPEIRQDADRGRYEAYSGDLSIPIVLHTDAKQVQMNVTYQGCSSAGVCYPPITKNVTLNLQDQSTLQMINVSSVKQPDTSWRALLTNQNGVRDLLNTQHFGIMLLIFAGLGLLLAFTPCVLPMVPILTSIILGQGKTPSTKKAFFLSSSYVLGMAMTYALAGLIAASLGSSIQVWLQKPMFIMAGSAIFIFLALSLFGLYDLRMPRRMHNKVIHWSNKHEGGTYIGVFFMGVLSTLIVSPCVTAPLVGVLIYMGQTGDMVLGASALFTMGIGMGIPLMLIGISAGRFLPKSGQWMEAVKKLFGIIMLGMAIWMLSRIATPVITNILLGLLLLSIAIFFAIYLPRHLGWYKLNRSLGFAVGLAGLLFIANSVITQPFSFLRIPTQIANQFIIVHSVNDLNKQLLIAQTARKPVLLDFYADWCESCIVMDKNVFSKPEVMHLLNNFVLLRADLSENTSNDEILLKNFNVIAPPTVLFFNQVGHEEDTHRIVGEVNKQEFLTRLTTFITTNCDKNLRC